MLNPFPKHLFPPLLPVLKLSPLPEVSFPQLEENWVKKGQEGEWINTPLLLSAFALQIVHLHYAIEKLCRDSNSGSLSNV